MHETAQRLLRLLSLLQTRRDWSGQVLCDRLEVDRRTVRRDVDRLRDLGYSIDSSSGPGGGYRFGPGSQMPPLLLDDEEAVAVTVALQNAAHSIAGLQETALGVLVKLQQLLPTRLRERLSALQAMTVTLRGSREPLNIAHLTAIGTACRECKVLSFDYEDRKGQSLRRRVEPFRLAHTGRRWYLVGFDLDRDAWRTFRVDRVSGAPAFGQSFLPRELPGNVEEYVSESIAVAAYSCRARVRLKGSAEVNAGRVPAWLGVIDAFDKKSCFLSIGAPSPEVLVAQLLMLGVDFELIEPPEMAASIKAASARLQRALIGVSTRNASRRRRARLSEV